MDTSSSQSVASGTLLAGKYRVERLLGEGGMGVVLAATNEALRQRVAIKLLRTGALANAKALGRFEREARAAASLRSEHVARVLDVGKLDDGRPYMVMEHLEGRDLGDLIDDGPPLAVSDAIDFVLQACEAIAEAHAAGIIHRDLKPKNMFLATTVDGRPLVKVLDFGISKMEDAAEDMSLTRTTEVIGSPSYMSPEQLRSSKDVDVRTDIWALGVILYELLTKRLPFEAETVTELVAVVLTDPIPDVRVLRPDVPAALAHAITHGCLAKKRDERFPSVAALVRAIAPFGHGDEVVTFLDRADRVARVAAGSGRSLPPITGSGPYAAAAPVAALETGPITDRETVAATPRTSGPPVSAPVSLPAPGGSSARLAIHGGTSVAWGETQVDGSARSVARRRSRGPVVAAVSVVMLLACATGGVLVFRRVTASPLATTQPSSALTTSAVSASPSPLPLPEGRHDLPPLASAPADATVAPVLAPAVSASGAPTARASAQPTKAAPARPGKASPPPVTPITPSPKPDDLSNIGRR